MQPITILLLAVALIVASMTLLVAAERPEMESSSHPEVVRTNPILRELEVQPIAPATSDACPDSTVQKTDASSKRGSDQERCAGQSDLKTDSKQ